MAFTVLRDADINRHDFYFKGFPPGAVVHQVAALRGLLPVPFAESPARVGQRAAQFRAYEAVPAFLPAHRGKYDAFSYWYNTFPAYFVCDGACDIKTYKPA